MVFNIFISSDNYSIVIDIDKIRLDEILICLEEQYGSSAIKSASQEEDNGSS